MLIKLGSVINAASGKLGGMVVQKDHSGMHLRVNSFKHQKFAYSIYNSRSFMAAISKGWQTLTISQRKQYMNSLYDLKTPFQSFVRLNMRRFQSQQSLWLIPQPTTDSWSCTSFTSQASKAPQSFYVQVQPDRPSNWYIFVFATLPYSHSVSFNLRKYKLIYAHNMSASTVLNISTDYFRRFPITFRSNNIIYSKFYVVPVYDPRPPVYYYSSCIVP